ncbi:MAG: signal recognition particle-docking protein FtsY [Deltaproteobacteria bacterium]|nr:signal recognition particle-docking protein FtsY [Deltaproteobacteria bacterium]MBI3293708.1 signal recognition particle-docking protein FtsY [Deltaproteobacteria bacterium]
MAAPASGFNRPLEKTRSSLAAKLSQFLRSDRQLDQAVWEGLEEALLTSDVGVSTTQRLLGAVKGRATGQDTTALRSLLVDEAIKLFPSGRTFPIEPRPLVISIVGVNGAGKTTTIGKLCARFSREGKNVLVGAADTFRAAATEQLKVWAQRAGADFVSGREGADPAAVAFDSVSAGKARGKDVVIIDTAGRLHTKENLMEELKKVHRVIKKVMPEAPHEVLLVLDGTTGQNALAQARQFSSDLGVTGLIVTKLDGTAKGGAVLGICSELAVPVRFVGVGEKSEDLIDFNDRQYVEALLEA